MNTVRCISLWQPWASLMACGVKRLETRGWATVAKGEVFIHAAKTKAGLTAMRAADPRAIVEMEEALGIPWGEWGKRLPFGALIARGNLVGCVTAWRGLADFPDQECFGDFGPGRWAHVYEDLRAIEPPIPYRGAQGFFRATIPHCAGCALDPAERKWVRYKELPPVGRRRLTCRRE